MFMYSSHKIPKTAFAFNGRIICYMCTVSYTGTQSFYKLLSYKLALIIWVLSLNLDWLVQTCSVQTFKSTE